MPRTPGGCSFGPPCRSSAVATGLGVLRNPSLAPVVGADHLLVPAAVKASMLHVFLLALTKICLNGYSAQRSS